MLLQSACLVIGPFTVNLFAALYNCMPVGRASYSIMASTNARHFRWLGSQQFRLLLGSLGFNDYFIINLDYHRYYGCRNTLFLLSPRLCSIIL